EEAWGRLSRWDDKSRRVDFDTNDFALQPVALRRRLVRRALQIVAGTLVDFSFAHVEDAASVLSAAEDAPAGVDLPQGVRVERSGSTGTVRLRKIERDAARLAEACGRPIAEDKPIAVVAGTSIDLERGWTLETAVVDPALERPEMGDWHASFDYDAFAVLDPPVVRRRAPGDWIRPLGMDGRRRLQDLMVDAKIPRECRAGLAVVALEGSSEVLWVPGPGGRRSSHAPLTRDTRRVLAMRFIKQE
ncbi:MAG TPA: tRNA lysidine(34) synthetase TilS, partial [Chloroflexia bacterium]|nr:tRNA lysidine(34) synthetase TilS [Chloroflexia bacterium]